MHVEQRPSGLLVATHRTRSEPAPLAPPKRPEGDPCRYCGKRSAEKADGPHFGGRTKDGFDRAWPTCGHDWFLVCPECEAKVAAGELASLGCPACGCQWQYT